MNIFKNFVKVSLARNLLRPTLVLLVPEAPEGARYGHGGRSTGRRMPKKR